MKLISMLEFVLLCRTKLQNGTLTANNYVEHTGAYARFLTQPISMTMFVPADKLVDLPGGKEQVPETNPIFPDLEDKVVFKNLIIEYTDISKKFYIKKSNGFFVISGTRAMFDNNLTIDHLVHRELELTENAVKLIFG